ncbi:MAG: HAD family phosphatase [Erysipelotrichaceae bacterium]|nr:HAD family phosphatase [Erysipelotrichaceae bacterium]
MSRLKLAIFDMDGTLVNTEHCMWYESEKKAFLHLGYPFDENFIDSFCGMNERDIAITIRNRFGEDFPMDEYMRIVYDENRNFLMHGEIPVIGGSFEILDYLKEKGITCCIATGSPRWIAELALKNTGLLPYFDYIISGDEISKGKPDPQIYLTSLAHYGYEKDEAVIFEDAPLGARSAIDSGIPLIYIPNVINVPQKEKDEAFRVVNSLKEALEIVKTLV